MTTYRLAKTKSDYDKCVEKHGSSQNFNYPTVMAERGNEVVGFISSYDFKPDYAPSAIQAISIHVLIKLFELYDRVLAENNQYFYVIHISKKNKAIIRVLNNWKNVIPSNSDDEFLYYIRGIERWAMSEKRN